MGRRTRTQRNSLVAVAARKRFANAHEPPGASGGEGGDGDEPPLQRRRRRAALAEAAS